MHAMQTQEGNEMDTSSNDSSLTVSREVHEPWQGCCHTL